MRPDFDEIRTLTKRFVLIPQKAAKFVFGVLRYADLSVLRRVDDHSLANYCVSKLLRNAVTYVRACVRPSVRPSVHPSGHSVKLTALRRTEVPGRDRL